MTLKRQYTLPNCTLILEGMESTSEETVDILDGQLPMAILINAECKFTRSNRQLSGGSIFLENLSKAASNYAQGFLSGLPHPPETTTEYPQIHLEKVADNHLHRLIVEPNPDSGEEKVEIDLTTVELFDLVDAIDRFYADRNTLPNMSLEIEVLSKRYRRPEQPLVERATPAAIGVIGLVLAAGAFLLIPPPPVTEPEPESELTPTETIPNTPETTPPGIDPEPAEQE